jgi:DNA-binding MarR family transcriptional regulator
MRLVAEKVVLLRSNLTRLADRLEEAGLLQRERSEEDRRGAYAVLTVDGKAMRRRMWPVYAEAIRQLFESQITDAQAQVMAEALRGTLEAARGTPAPEADGSNRSARKQRAGKR